ncbi:MAG TPA: SRPBCC family protein [Pseudonocardiaceae bacterium]|nr:SRPBCC family protein [Pseudonocardiaceae bacterium]
MPVYEKSVDVAVPVRVAYDQWTQFETFPMFMSGVDQITQETPTRTHWVTSVGGVRREFDATITEQQPDERIAWRADNGPTQAGVVTFHRLSDEATRVHLQLELEPEGIAERAGAVTGVLGHSLQGDLVRFKEFVEGAGQQTGGWRGAVDPEPQHNPVIGHTPESPRG